MQKHCPQQEVNIHQPINYPPITSSILRLLADRLYHKLVRPFVTKWTTSYTTPIGKENPVFYLQHISPWPARKHQHSYTHKVNEIDQWKTEPPVVFKATTRRKHPQPLLQRRRLIKYVEINSFLTSADMGCCDTGPSDMILSLVASVKQPTSE